MVLVLIHVQHLTLVLQGVIDIPNDKDFDKKLQECLKRTMYAVSSESNSLLTKCLSGELDSNVSGILSVLNLTLVQFQAPLFCSLCISPILLFRTCSLQSARFGRHYYLSVSSNIQVP